MYFFGLLLALLPIPVELSPIDLGEVPDIADLGIWPKSGQVGREGL